MTRKCSIHRLRKTWDGVDTSILKIYRELEDIVLPDGNYAKLKLLLRTSTELKNQPVIPYLGAYLTDLAFIEDAQEDVIDNLINFDKIRKISSILKEIRQYQTIPYCFKVVPVIKGFLLASGEYFDEQECYELSLKLEPKGNCEGSKGNH